MVRWIGWVRSPGSNANCTLPGGLGEKEPLTKGAVGESKRIWLKVADKVGTENFPYFLSGAKAEEKEIGVKGFKIFGMSLMRKIWPFDQTMVTT